jgi:hypothetical protein
VCCVRVPSIPLCESNEMNCQRFQFLLNAFLPAFDISIDMIVFTLNFTIEYIIQKTATINKAVVTI